MERGARRTHVVLRHEGDRRAHQVRDLLRTVLVESRAVGHLERLRVAEVDLLLAAPPLSLRRLDRNVGAFRSEEHTSELQSHSDLVCRLLLEKKKTQKIQV